MRKEIGRQNTDSLLRHYLGAEDDAAADTCLRELMDAADPIIRRVVSCNLAANGRSSRLCRQQVEEAGAVARERLLVRLHHLRRFPTAKQIVDLPAYVAAVAENACIDQFRRGDVRAVVSMSPQESDEAEGRIIADEMDPSPSSFHCAERRLYLEMVWTELMQLNVRQRRALLLSMGEIVLFPVFRVASIRDIAAALEMQAEEFIETWSMIPFDDRQIAQRMGCKRQDVINLRAAARARLSRKMRNWQ